MDNSKARFHILSIENFVLKILKQNPPGIILKDWKQWRNSQFTDRLMLKTEEISERHVRFDAVRSRSIFTIIIYLLAKIYSMLQTNTCYTKRELYYQEVEFIKCQTTLDVAIHIICSLLECPPWEIGVMGTSKGLVCGPLVVKVDSEEVIDCSSPGGTLIPHFVCSPSVELRSSARYVLLVEKDATFQRLLSENVLNKLPDLLLVTGKGFPDVNTRILINKLSQNLKLPVLALVDADPFGIAIMCVYRFGSLNMCNYAENLVAPKIRWLGIHPTDIKRHDVMTLPFEKSDLIKLHILAKRVFIKSNKDLVKQINILLELGRKAEIEAMCDFSSDYLIKVYIPSKILNNELY